MMMQEPAGGVPTFVNVASALDPLPYALADQYNNSMRYPDELALYNRRVAAVDNAGIPLYPNEQPTLRLLLEDMYQRPNQYLNAIVVNLHGELLPFPPIRNYSDAAKKPDFYTPGPGIAHNGVRVVTHPENLAYDTTVAPNASVNLRVYSYLTNPLPNPDAPGAGIGPAQIREPNALGNPVDIPQFREILNEPITIILRGINWNPNNIAGDRITAITGGVDLDQRLYSSPNTTDFVPPAAMPANPRSVRDPYAVVLAAPNADLIAPNRQMYWTREFIAGVPGDTVIKLWNSPLISPCVPNPADCNSRQLGAWAGGAPYVANSNSGGVQHNTPTNTRRLYGMEYVPSPMENFAQGVAQTPFNINLATAGGVTKNTARWILQIPAAVLPPDSTISVETMIGDLNVVTGVLDPSPGHPLAPYNELPNFSRTFVWRGTTNWLFGPGGAAGNGNLPVTERYQVIGDPRHCPYADLKKPHMNNAGAYHANNVNTRLGMGYNRYFDDFENADVAWIAGGNYSAPGAWDGWEYAGAGGPYGIKNDNAALGSVNKNNDNWATTNGGIEVDVPRIYQIFRGGLMFSNSIYTTMTGWPYYYLGIGNEIGYDSANGFDDNVPVSRRPFDGTDNPGYFEQAITPGKDWGDTGDPADPIGTSGPLRASVKYIAEANGGWWSMHWLGELYPDRRYIVAGANNDWKEVGNLPPPDPTAGEPANRADRYRRIRRDNLPTNNAANPTHTPGTTFRFTSRRTHEQGVPTFFWLNAANQTVDVTSVGGGLAGVRTGATEIQTTWNFPLDPQIDASRPFETARAAPASDGLGQNVYSARINIGEMREFYSNNQQAGWHSSLLLSAQDSANGSRTMYIVENGLSPSGVAGTDFIARWAFLSLIQGFFEAGLFNGGNDPAVTQLPRTRITSPNPNTNLTNPSNITVTWAVEYRRWDGRPYANAYPGGFTENAPLSYYVTYSDDNGQTWKYIQDNSTAVPGVRLDPTDPRYASCRITGATTTTWNVSSLPAGAYIIKVEAYRDAFPLHYSYHQYQAFIVR
jgi:hypothetical protein